VEIQYPHTVISALQSSTERDEGVGSWRAA
jgi:hypothetical protein